MTKATVQLFRQGDVMFRRIDKLPKGTRKKRKDATVAYGEVTGHSHRLADTEAAEVLEIGDGLYVHVSGDGVRIEATFIHEEHGPITLPAGEYEVTIQKEYNPKAVRSVVD